MTQRQLKSGYFVLAALNTLANCYFFNYLVFYLRDQFGFGNRQNLWASALYGFIYIFSAWQCGRFAQRRGFLTSLKVGFSGLMLLMLIGGFLTSAPGVICILAAYGILLLFTWPALEALVSENETKSGVQHMVGVYNCTWSAAAALAYFTGGPLYDRMGRGAIFWLPAGLFLTQLILLQRLSHRSKTALPTPAGPDEQAGAAEPGAGGRAMNPRGFLKMAWLANPFAYVAMNTLLAVMPGIAQKLDLSPTRVGLYCSIWFFARFAAFGILWKWTGWHYRFGWLFSAFLALIISFTFLLLAGKLWVFALAQIFFGLSAGLIYYSSLFYSMDLGDASAEHGGLHEAAIGAGICAGPAVGAASLQFLPDQPNAGAFAVTGLLGLGLGGLLALRRSQRSTAGGLPPRENGGDPGQ